MSRGLTIFIFWINILVYPQDTWIKIYNDFLYSYPLAFIQTENNEFIITGLASVNRRAEAFLMKTDSSGDVIWSNSFSERSYTDARSIIETKDGNYIFVGTTSNNSENPYVLITKVDDKGNLIWARNYETKYKYSFGISINSILNSDDYIISFNTDSVGIMEINDEGNIIWKKMIDSGTGYNIVETSEGGFAIMYVKSSILNLAIIDRNGNVVIKREYNEYFPMEGNSIQQTNDNGFIISALFCTNFWLIKTNKVGEIEWDKKYEGVVSGIKQTKDNGYVITGCWKNEQDIMICRISDTGNIIWQKFYKCPILWNNSGTSVVINNKSYFILGTISSENQIPPEYRYHKTILIKTDTLGSNLDDLPTSVDSHENDFVFYLMQNYPNPFNPTTTIRYSIPVETGHAPSLHTTLKVYDVLGKEVTTLVNEEKSAGNYEVEFSASTLPSGIYFYKLQAGNFSSVKKMILLK